MAKSKATRRRRKAASPRTIKICGLEYPLVKGCIEVDGHVFEAKQIEEFKAKADARLATALTPSPYLPQPCNPEGWARDMGLDDLIAPHRPSKRAKERISLLAIELSHCALACGAMSEFLFWDHRARATGCKALKELITAAETPLMKLRWLANTMEREGEEKLQDWIAHEKYYHTIGKQEAQS